METFRGPIDTSTLKCNINVNLALVLWSLPSDLLIKCSESKNRETNWVERNQSFLKRHMYLPTKDCYSWYTKNS